MAVDQFEVFHGVVLTKLVRSARPITLRLIETRPAEAWAAYTLNNAVDLFMKHSATPKLVRGGGGERSWHFTVGQVQLAEMASSRSSRRLYVALIGGSAQVKDSHKWSVCLLEPNQVEELLDFTPRKLMDFSSTFQQSIIVRWTPGKQLRVYKEGKEKFKVPQNRLDNWKVPGG